MNFIRKAATTLGGIFLAALLIAALAPKATHGLVAALVQVTNTTSNPAVTLDADASTRLPYQSYQTVNTGGGGDEQLNASFPEVPAGYRLVIQNINSGFYIVDKTFTPNGYVTTTFAPDKTFPQFMGSVEDFGTFAFSIIDSSVTRYVGPGDTPSVYIQAYFYPSQTFPITVTGYLENCAVTGCPAPVH